jgi:pimeloyl-ACP methyl ester carboxylesterase
VVSFEFNYRQFGWVETLINRGFQVIGIDLRGHGQSDKPIGSEYYGTSNLATDVTNLIDHLGLKRPALMGYSLGTAIALELLHKQPKRFSHGALIATGDGLLGHSPFIFNDILPGLAKLFAYPEFPSHLPTHISSYWKFFHATGLELSSMQSFVEGNYPHLSEEEASTISTPILIVSGEKDMVLGQGSHLARTLANGSYLEIAGADHFSLAANAQTHKEVSEFLADGSLQG